VWYLELFDCWVYLWNQSVWHSNTINFNGIIGNRILWKLRLKFHLCIGINGNFYSMVSNSGYSIESVSLLNLSCQFRQVLKRNTVDAVFCRLLYNRQNDGYSSTSFQLIAFNSLLQQFLLWRHPFQVLAGIK
jgi:hypothetical protein